MEKKRQLAAELEAKKEAARVAKIEAEGYRLLQKYSLTDIKYIYTVGDGSNNRIWEIIRQQLLNVSFSHPQYKKAAYGAAILARDQLQYNQLIS